MLSCLQENASLTSDERRTATGRSCLSVLASTAFVMTNALVRGIPLKPRRAYNEKKTESVAAPAEEVIPTVAVAQVVVAVAKSPIRRSR